MKFLSLESKTLIGGSVLLAVFSILSRLIGLYRDRVLASKFGTSEILDVYYVSFGIPDLIFNLLVIGAVSSAFIPVFIEYRERSESQAWQLVRNFLNFLVLAVIVAGIISFIFMPQIIDLIGPGFNVGQMQLAVLYGRVMVLSPLLFSISIVAGSLLQAYKRFLAFSIAPLFYNFGIIIGAVLFVPWFGPLGLAEGVVLGALLHLLVQWREVVRLGFRWSPFLDLRSEGLIKIIKLMVPRSAGLAITQINWIFLNALATTTFLGGAAMLNFANNLQYLPIAVAGISLGIAAFPNMSREALREDKQVFVKDSESVLRLSLFLSIPLSFFIFYFSHEISAIILGAGKFGINDIETTSKILRLFMIGVFANAAIPILSRTFFAIQNTSIPFVGSLIAVTLNVFLAYYWLDDYEIFALPLSFSIAMIIYAVFLVVALSVKLKEFEIKTLVIHVLKVFLISAVSILSVLAIGELNIFNGERTISCMLLQISLSGGAFLLTCFFVSFMLKLKELKFFGLR